MTKSDYAVTISLVGAKTEPRRASFADPVALGVFVAALLPFLPVLRNGFVDWDDGRFILRNAPLQAFDLRWMWTSFEGGYQPLGWLSLALDWRLWGAAAWGFHLSSLLLHGLAAATLFLIARRLLPAAGAGAAAGAAAALAALLYAAHPLRAESVAWAAARHQLLAVWLCLMAVLAYVDGRRRAALLWFIASLSAKGAGLTLPATLLVLDVYPLRRLPPHPRDWLAPPARRTLAEKIPFALAALAAAGLNLYSRTTDGALRDYTDLGAAARLANAAYALAFYLGKTLWPADLAVLYPAPAQPDLFAWPYGGCAVLVMALGTGAWLYRRRSPAPLAAAAHYAAALLPVLGLIRVGQHLTADRYSSLSAAGLAVLAAGAWAALWQRRPLWRRGLAAAAASVLLALAALSWRQSGVWRDTETLWRHAIASGVDVAAGRNTLGNYYARLGRLREAEAQYRAGLRLAPEHALAWNGLGLVLGKTGRYAEAAQAHRRAVALQPRLWHARNNLALMLARLGRFDESAAEFERTLALSPGRAEIHLNYGLMLATAGRRRAAVEQLRRALALDGRLNAARAALAALDPERPGP